MWLLPSLWSLLLGRARGVQLGEDEIDPNDPSLFGAQKNMSLFGPRVPVQSTERQLIAVMPEALIVVDSLASVTYVSRARNVSALLRTVR